MSMCWDFYDDTYTVEIELYVEAYAGKELEARIRGFRADFSILMQNYPARLWSGIEWQWHVSDECFDEGWCDPDLRHTLKVMNEAKTCIDDEYKFIFPYVDALITLYEAAIEHGWKVTWRTDWIEGGPHLCD